jgi:tetratricopeptide (TPR) repeat protein
MLAHGDTTGAIDLLEHSNLDQHPDPRAYILLGQVWRERGTIDGRLRSQHVLEDARSRFPRDVAVLIELGRTYFAQRFFPDAVGTLQHALEIDPKRCDARYLIGLYHYRNWKRLNSYKDDLDVARRNLRTAWSCDPANIEAAKLYLYARYALADTSAREANEMAARYPKEACFQFYRGALAYDAKQYDTCGRYFERGLALLPASDREVYEDLSSVLPVNSANRYLETPRDAREVLRRGYWVAGDPDPTTAVTSASSSTSTAYSSPTCSSPTTGRGGGVGAATAARPSSSSAHRSRSSMGWGRHPATDTRRRGRTIGAVSSASSCSWTNS